MKFLRFSAVLMLVFGAFFNTAFAAPVKISLDIDPVQCAAYDTLGNCTRWLYGTQELYVENNDVYYLNGSTKVYLTPGSNGNQIDPPQRYHVVTFVRNCPTDNSPNIKEFAKWGFFGYYQQSNCNNCTQYINGGHMQTNSNRITDEGLQAARSYTSDKYWYGLWGDESTYGPVHFPTTDGENPDVSCPGYVFIGWYRDAYSDDDPVTYNYNYNNNSGYWPNGDETVYAHWRAIPDESCNVTLTFSAGTQGTFDGNCGSIDFTGGVPGNRLSRSCIPTPNNNCTFIGYFYNSNKYYGYAGNAVASANLWNALCDQESVEFVARYSCDKSCNQVIFDHSGGIFANSDGADPVLYTRDGGQGFFKYDNCTGEYQGEPSPGQLKLPGVENAEFKGYYETREHQYIFNQAYQFQGADFAPGAQAVVLKAYWMCKDNTACDGTDTFDGYRMLCGPEPDMDPDLTGPLPTLVDGLSTDDPYTGPGDETTLKERCCITGSKTPCCKGENRVVDGWYFRTTAGDQNTRILSYGDIFDNGGISFGQSPYWARGTRVTELRPRCVESNSVGCYKISFADMNGRSPNGELDLYRKDDKWYSDAECKNIYDEIPVRKPVYGNLAFKGYFTSVNDGQMIFMHDTNANNYLKENTDVTYAWRVYSDTTLYAQWCNANQVVNSSGECVYSQIKLACADGTDYFTVNMNPGDDIAAKIKEEFERNCVDYLSCSNNGTFVPTGWRVASSGTLPTVVSEEMDENNILPVDFFQDDQGTTSDPSVIKNITFDTDWNNVSLTLVGSCQYNATYECGDHGSYDDGTGHKSGSYTDPTEPVAGESYTVLNFGLPNVPCIADTGYVFNGWVSNETLSPVYNQSSSDIINSWPNQNITFTAQYTCDTGYELNGKGECVGSGTLALACAEGAEPISIAATDGGNISQLFSTAFAENCVNYEHCPNNGTFVPTGIRVTSSTGTLPDVLSAAVDENGMLSEDFLNSNQSLTYDSTWNGVTWTIVGECHYDAEYECGDHGHSTNTGGDSPESSVSSYSEKPAAGGQYTVLTFAAANCAADTGYVFDGWKSDYPSPDTIYGRNETVINSYPQRGVTFTAQYTCDTDYEDDGNGGCRAKAGSNDITITLKADGKRTSCPEWWTVVGPSDSGGDNKCRCLAWNGATLNSNGSNCTRYDFSGSSKLTVNHTTNPAEITYDDKNGEQTLISTDEGALWMPQRFLVVHYNMNCPSGQPGDAPGDAQAKWGYKAYYGDSGYNTAPYTYAHSTATNGNTRLSSEGQNNALGYSADTTWYLKWDLGYKPIQLPSNSMDHPDIITCAGYVFDYWSESSQDEAQEVRQCNYDTTENGDSQYGYLPSKCVSQFMYPNTQNCTATTNYASDDCTDTTLYAHWHPGIFEVKLNVNGGTPGSQNQDQIYEKYATGWATTRNSQYWTSITLSGDQLPQRSGYRFLGYYNAREGGQLQGSLNNGAWTITPDDATAVTVEPTTWYAHWAEIQTYNIYCMPNTSGQNPNPLDMNAIQQGDLIPVAIGLEFETGYARPENEIIRACCKQKDPDTGEYSSADGSVENCCPAGYIMPESVVGTPDVPLYGMGDTVHVWNSYDPDNNGVSYDAPGNPWWYLIRDIFSSMDGSAILIPRCEEAPTAICHKIVFDNNSETDSTTNSNVSLFRKDGEPDKWYINSDCTTTESGISLGVRKPSNGNEIFAGYYYGSSKQIFTKNTYTNGIILKPNDEEANNWDVTGLGDPESHKITLDAIWGVGITFQCSADADPVDEHGRIIDFDTLVTLDAIELHLSKCMCPGSSTNNGIAGLYIVGDVPPQLMGSVDENNMLPASFFTYENLATLGQYLDGLNMYPELICKYDVTYVCHNGSQNYPGTATMGEEYTVKTFDEVSEDISDGCGVPDEHAVFSGWTLDLIEGSGYTANQTSVIQSWPGGNGTFTAQYVCAEGYTNSGTPENPVCEEQNNTVTFHFICRPERGVLKDAASVLGIDENEINAHLADIYYDVDYVYDSQVGANGVFLAPTFQIGSSGNYQYKCGFKPEIMQTGWFANQSSWRMSQGNYWWSILATNTSDMNTYTEVIYAPSAWASHSYSLNNCCNPYVSENDPSYNVECCRSLSRLAEDANYTFLARIGWHTGTAMYKCSESESDPTQDNTNRYHSVSFSSRTSYNVEDVVHHFSGESSTYGIITCPVPANSNGFKGWRAKQNVRQNDPNHVENYLSSNHQNLNNVNPNENDGLFVAGELVGQHDITAFPPREVYFVAVWDCEDGYSYDIESGECVQDISVTYMCYAGDANTEHHKPDIVNTTSYTVKGFVSGLANFPEMCSINNDNLNKWYFSGDSQLYAPSNTIEDWSYGNGKTFVPGYTATFECGSCFPNAPQHTIYVALGDTINLPTVAQICGTVSSECEGLVDTSLGWKTQYPENIGTSPVTGADCPATLAGQYVDAPSPFSWQCPTDLTFKPIGDFSEEVTHLVCCPYNNNCFEVPGESGPGADYTTGEDLQDWIEAHPDLCPLSPCQNGGRAGWVGWKVAASGNNIPTEVMSQMIVDPLHQQTTQYILPFNYTFNNQLLDSHYGFSVKPVAACFYDVTYNCAGYGSGTVDRYVGDMQYQGALYPATVAVWPGGGAVLRGSDGDNGVNYVIKTSSDAQCGRDDGHIFDNWTFSGNPDYTDTNTTFNGGDVLPWPHYWFTNGPWWEGHPGTFTANWVWDPNGGQCHTVTFDDNNGNSSSINNPRHKRKNQTGWYNSDCSEVTNDGNVNIPNKAGSRFTGYKQQGTSTMVFNGNGSMVDPDWTISSNVTLVAQWNCSGTQFYDATTGLCTNCPTGFPYADADATSAAQCYRTCQDHCNQVGCPVDDCTYINTDVLIDGRIYNNGTNTCVVNNCDWTINSCPPGQYINYDTCESCPTGFTSGAGADDITDCYKTCTAYCIQSGCDSETLHAHDPNASVSSCQYTTSTLSGEQHCNAANNGTCTDVSACSAASEMCPYTYDCKPLYHHNPEHGDLCESCQEGYYWNENDEECKSCNLMIHDNHNWTTRPPHNTSIDHCYRLCENVTCQTAQIYPQNINDVEQFLTNPGGQVSFYGNEQQGLDVCNRNPEVPYCPVILLGQGTSISNEQHAVKPMHLKVNFYDGLEGAHLAGERYIVGPRNSNDILVNGRYGWSQIMGYGQLNTNRRYPIVMYPSFIAPEAASVENLGFIGYYDRQNSQPGPWTVQYTDAGRALNTGNASLVVERQGGNPTITHKLYARYSECESPNFPDPETGECGWCPEGYTDNPDATSFEECYGYDSCGNGNCNVNCPTGEHIICVPTVVLVPYVQYANDPGNCVPSADCVNTITCDSGYYWNGTSCVPESQYVIHLDYSVDDTNHLLETNPRRNLYTIHNTGVYLDSGRTQQMSTNNNPIEEPHKYINVTLNAMGGTVQDWGSEPGGVVTDRIYFKFKGFYRNQDTVTNGDKFIELRDQYGYITNDGSNAGKSYNADTTWYAHWYSTSIDLPSAERDGYQFLGWFTENGTTPMSMPVRPNDDITYYAHWTKCAPGQIVINGVCTNCSCTEGNGIEQGTCSAYAVSGNQCNATAECASNYGNLVVNCSGANCTVSCSACDPTANQITINSQCITCNCTSSNSANCGTFSNDNNMCNWSMECMPGYVNLNQNCIGTGNTTCNPTCAACTCDPVANTGVSSCPSTVSNDACTYGPTCNPGYHNPEVFECSGTGNTYCKAQCHMCPEGTYGPDGEQCVQCPAGYTAPAGSTSEEDCYGNPNTYKITYLSNNNQNAMAVQSVAYNTAFTTKTPSELGFSRLGYIVTQWDVDADSEPTVTFTNYDSENNVHYARVGEPQYEHYLDMHDITLKAHWHICPEGTYQDGNICRDCPAGYNAPAGSYLVEHCYAIQYKITYQSGTVPQTFYVQSPITVGQSFTTESGTRFNNTGYMMTRWDSVSGGEYPELSHQYTYDVAIDTVLRANWEQCTCPRENWGNGVLNCVPTSVTDENRCTATVTCETGYEPAEPNCTRTVCSVHCEKVKSNAVYDCNCSHATGVTGTPPNVELVEYGTEYTVKPNNGANGDAGCAKANTVFIGWLHSNHVYVPNDSSNNHLTWDYTSEQTFCAQYCSECQRIEHGTNEAVFVNGACGCAQICDPGYEPVGGICKPKTFKLRYKPSCDALDWTHQRNHSFGQPFTVLGYSDVGYVNSGKRMTWWDLESDVGIETFQNRRANLGGTYTYNTNDDITLCAHWESCPNNSISIDNECVTCNCTSSNSADCGAFSNDNNMCNWSMECKAGYINLNRNCTGTGDTDCKPTCTACTCNLGTGVNSCQPTASNDVCTYVPTCKLGYHNPTLECNGTGDTNCDASCTICPEDTYGPDGEQCIHCDPGYTAPAGSTSADACVPKEYHLYYQSDYGQNRTHEQGVFYNAGFTTAKASDAGFAYDNHIITLWDVVGRPTNTFAAGYAEVGHTYNAYIDAADTTLKARWEACECRFGENDGVASCSTPISNNSCGYKITCKPGYVNPHTENCGGTGNLHCNAKCEPCPAGTYQAGDHCEDCDPYMTSLPAATSIAECYWERCPEENQHIEHGDCVDNEKKCSAPDATDAVRVWNDTLKAYGACIVRECRDGYHISDNACVLDTCTVANGHGEYEQLPNNEWGCVVTACDAGYEINADETGCVECWNRRVNGEIAVSGYIYGCEIATCMYQGQKYALEMNECVPICSADRYDPNDQSGTITWDERTKKCVRTCNPGYKMW